jgi:TonB family protein
MKHHNFRWYFLICVVLSLAGAKLAYSSAAPGSQDQFHDALARAANLSTLAAPGEPPFHLKLVAKDTTMRNPDYNAEIEVWWSAPDKWRRSVKSPAFTQIAIQNGTRYYESNTDSDYLPYWLDELIRGSIDPIPVAALAEVSADEDRPGCGNWEVPHGSGEEMFSTYASVCFNADGTAREIFVEHISLELAAYQLFGNKKIARQIGVWPGGRSEITATITELEPLKKWQPSGSDTPVSELFDAHGDSVFTSRVRFVSAPESALSPADSPARPPLVWPASYTFPLTGVIAVKVQIDRAGNIRELPSAISKNQAINTAAVEQIKNWKFKPYQVDGSRVEVVTTLTVPFQLKYEPLGANGKEFPPISFAEHMKRYHALSDLRSEDNTPFQLRASFVLSNGQAGRYEETWQSPEGWTRQVELGRNVLGETRIDGKTATRYDGDSQLQAEMLAVIGMMEDRFPELHTFQEADWGNSAVPESNVYPARDVDSSERVLIRAAVGAVDAKNHPISGQAYWFDSDGRLRATFAAGTTVVNSNFAPCDLKQVPRRIELFTGTAPTAEITVDSIEAPRNSQPALSVGR